MVAPMALSEDLRNEIQECLRRSGYLLESRLVRRLADIGFFVEPNVAIADRRTGKSREIDIVAEYFAYETDHPGVAARSHFAIEAINNNLPLVVMTPYPGSMDAEFDDLRYATTPPYPNPFETDVALYEEKGIYRRTLYAQYCALTRKRAGDELMASHPDDLYSSLLKLAEFIEQQATDFETRKWPENDEYWRLWMWQGVLVLGGDLLIAIDAADGTLSLAETDEASLVFNFHLAEQPKTVVIDVVRERALVPYLKRAIDADHRLEVRMYEIRTLSPERAT